MSTPLTDSINALTTYANEVTGASDTNLSDAVYTLAQGYGSGGSSWTLVASTTYDVSITSSGTTTLDTLEVGEYIWTSANIVWVRIRDTAGKRDGYFYGNDTTFIQAISINGQSTSSTYVRGTFNYRVDSNSKYVVYTSAQGIYADYIYSDGSIRIRTTLGSGAIDGTYSVEVYLLTPPSTIFE